MEFKFFFFCCENDLKILYFQLGLFRDSFNKDIFVGISNKLYKKGYRDILNISEEKPNINNEKGSNLIQEKQFIGKPYEKKNPYPTKIRQSFPK